VSSPKEIPLPSKDLQLKTAEKFNKAVGFFPNCLGADDGKPIRIFGLLSSGLLYFNYKKYFLKLLIGVADASFCLTALDVCLNGREVDSNIFKISDILMKTTPTTTCLAFGQDTTPYHREVFDICVVVGDKACGLNEHLN
jgi:hypothetical protein